MPGRLQADSLESTAEARLLCPDQHESPDLSSMPLVCQTHFKSKPSILPSTVKMRVNNVESPSEALRTPLSIALKAYK